jgi:hypothetical protein
MPISKNTYHPVLYITRKASADIPAYRFVNYNGGLCGNEVKSLGSTDVKHANGENIAVQAIGTAVVECSVNLAIGDAVTSDANGKAKLATGTMPINGRVITAGTSGGYVTILLV